jgi:diguanylate cyclase (GGDEF)-like protein
MSTPADKDQVLGDHAAFLKALVPQAHGFICHDARGTVFWSESPPQGMPSVTDAYRATLVAVLNGGPLPGDGARVPLGANVAYVIRLEGDGGRLLGALSVLVERSAARMPYAFVKDVLAPALRSLQRELCLRIRLLEGQRKLSVQAAEERLLHKVEKLLHDRQPHAEALQCIVGLCREHLGVKGAWLLIPEKNIALIEGSELSESEVRMLGATLLEEARDAGFDHTAVNQRGDSIWLAVHPRGLDTQGVFVFDGIEQSDFSERRVARVARYVVSHIESLLDREFDVLTGLPAWPAFERSLVAAAAGADWEDHVALAFNIDQLHVVNETFGREAGNDVLRRFAAVLREVVPGHAASRVSGDLFAALLRSTDAETARGLAEEICRRFRDHAYVRDDQTHRPTVSIGVGPLAQGADATGALAAAQVACKAAKERGRGRVEVYESADVSIVRRLDDIQLVGYVRSAIENNRLALVAQQLMPLKPGRVPHYFEVLVRLVDDAGKHVAPGEFMSAAERYQLMEELDRWVVASTLELIARHGRHLRGGEVRFAINLSGQSLGSDAFLKFVESAVETSKVAADLITFEITESVAVARMQQAQVFMQALRRLGCHFSLDDFGTGLSSFAYLKVFPVDTLKIDGSFVRDISSNVVSQSVVAAIAEVARVMQLETVAEYVQEQAALDLLRNLNISYAQGYHVGTTAPLEEQIRGIDHIVASGSHPISSTA